MPITNDQIFTPRSIAQARRLIPPVHTFLRDRFFGSVMSYKSEAVDMDREVELREMAPFSSGSIYTFKRNALTARTIRAPAIDIKVPFSGHDGVVRQAGEVPYMPMSPQERMAASLGNDIAFLQRRQARRVEWMCAQAISTGKCVIGDLTNEGHSVSGEVDYLMPAGNLVAPAILWSESATADPEGNIKAWSKLITRGGHVTPDTLILGSEAEDAFVAVTSVKDTLDNRRIEGMSRQITTANMTGVRALGMIGGLEVYAYDEESSEIGGDPATLIPTDAAILGSRQSGGSISTGVLRNLNVPVEQAQGEMFIQSWIEKNGTARYVHLESHPLPTFNPEAFVVATVV